MCGIAGAVGCFNPELYRKMSTILRHRGPDGEGVLFDIKAEVGLVHTRLSIIDLSDAGSQPMALGNDDFVIVFNGEIYNYQELRKELVADGFDFKGHSDTEVLINLYCRDVCVQISFLILYEVCTMGCFGSFYESFCSK